MHTNIITKSRSIFRVYAGCSFTSLQSSSELVRKSGSTGFIDRTGRTRVTRDVRFRLSGEIYKLTWRIDPWLSPPANADCDSVDLKSFLAFHQAGAMTVASQHLSRKDFCSSVKQFSFTVFCILKAVWENQPPAVRRFAGCPEAPGADAASGSHRCTEICFRQRQERARSDPRFCLAAPETTGEGLDPWMKNSFAKAVCWTITQGLEIHVGTSDFLDSAARTEYRKAYVQYQVATFTHSTALRGRLPPGSHCFTYETMRIR